MALNLQSLSITSVFNSIVNFFRSQENNSKWKDLTTGSEGSFLIRLLSNVFSAISYRIVAQSRENYISTAALTSSNTGIAVNLGYSVFRGSNLKRMVQLNPNGDYTFPKLSVIGTYSDQYDIICLEDVATEVGVPINIRTVVGKVKEETITAGTSGIKFFSLFTTGISEDYVLYLDSKEVPTTKYIKELKDDKYLVRTNPFSSVDIAYLNTFPGFKYKYGTGSEITIRYVELADVNVVPYTSNMFSYGELVGSSTISNYIPFEPVDSIKITAPLNHELQNLIRSKSDYAESLREKVPSVIDAGWKALTPTYTLITYLKSDKTLLTANEQENVLDLLREENFFGTPLPDITVPRREVAHIQIDIDLLDKYKNISDVELDVSNIIENYYNEALGISFNVYDLERRIESLSYVRYARVSHVINTREAGKNYQLGYILFHNDSYYMAAKILGISGDSRPNWNLPVGDIREIDTGLTTEDGNIVWKAYKRLPGMRNANLSEWAPNTQFGLSDYVYDLNYPNYMFKCIGLKKSSGATFPTITYAEKGDFITDGSIVWVVKDYNSEYPLWTSLTNYALGDSVNITAASGGYSLECVSFMGTTGTETDLEFEKESYLVVSQTLSTFTVEGDMRFYFREDDVISAAHEGGYTTFSVTSVDLVGLNTEITVNQEINPEIEYTSLYTEQRGTRDGQILWTLIEDISDITYEWNAYVTFEHTLNISGAVN